MRTRTRIHTPPGGVRIIDFSYTACDTAASLSPGLQIICIYSMYVYMYVRMYL